MSLVDLETIEACFCEVSLQNGSNLKKLEMFLQQKFGSSRVPLKIVFKVPDRSCFASTRTNFFQWLPWNGLRHGFYSNIVRTRERSP